MKNSIDRRFFMKSTAASAMFSAFSFNPSAFGVDYPLDMPLRKKEPAVVRGAFFYPPADVVYAGEFEDSWSREKWFTWPGNQFEPEAQHEKFSAQLKRITNDLDIDLKMDEKSIYTNAGIEAFIKEIQTNKPDALLLFNFWNTMSGKLKAVLDAFDGPIIVYHPLGANHQLPPKHFMTAPLTQYIHSIENWDALERGLRSIHAHSRVSKSRLLRISGRAKEEKAYAEPVFGTKVLDIPAQQFNDLFDSIEVTSAMKRFAKPVREEAMRVYDLSDKAFDDAVRSHVSVLKMLEQHEADAITIECLFLKHRKPCLSFSINNGNLIPCGCENDFNASMSLMIGSNLFGRGGFQHNPEFDTEENLYFASHCTCATKLHGPDGRSEKYWLRPFFHQMPKTLALDVIWPAGEPLTLFKFNSNEKQLNSWIGECIESPECPPTRRLRHPRTSQNTGCKQYLRHLPRPPSNPILRRFRTAG